MSSLGLGANFSLSEAEQSALKTSELLTAARLDTEVIEQQKQAGFSALLPRLSLQGSYTYLSTLPSLSMPANAPKLTFGDHNNYSVGPTLSYTLWDSFSALNSFQALENLKQSKQQDLQQTKIQLLFAVRSAYIRVQLAGEELKLVRSSLELAKTQQQDILNRFKAGSATQLDKLIAIRHVLSFEQQLKQRTADLKSATQDLQSLTASSETGELESLSETLDLWSQTGFSEPSAEQPKVKSLLLLAKASEKSAAAQQSKLFPTINLLASTTLAYPNGPVLDKINQNTIGLTLTLPLYLGDPTWHLITSKKREAEAAKHRARQVKIDLDRDYAKAKELYESLLDQKKLALELIKGSEEGARLYYDSYKAGKNSLTDVQLANNEALLAKVNSARIDAQILSQLVLLSALSGKE